MKKNIIHPFSTLKKELVKMRNDGFKKGDWVGFPELYEHWSVKRGGTTYIVAPPYSGKSVFINEILMNLAEYADYKIVIFSPETGSPKDLYAELLWVYLRKPFIMTGNDAIDSTDSEVEKAMKFISEHFFVLDPLEGDLNERLYFKAITELEEEYGIKIDCAVIDPITEFSLDGSAQRDLALGTFLTNIRKFSSAYDIHTIIAFHTKNMGIVEGKNITGQKVRYLPPATMFDVAGGEMASRKGLFILSLWRTPYNVVDKETGDVYPSNETRVSILKAKPKALGKIGVVKLYYDALSSRFKDEEGYFSRKEGAEVVQVPIGF